MRLRLNNRGDTIVEVMVVLAVLGLAIGICYATANRSLQNARQAQENSEASQLLIQQIEYLRTMSGIFASTNPFCIYNASLYPLINSPPKPLSDYSVYPPQCINSFYHVAVQYEGASPTSTDTFQLSAYWDDVSGQGQDTVTMFYRVHQ